MLVLRYYLDMDDTAIAEIIRIKESTVRSTAKRALASLRKCGKDGRSGGDCEPTARTERG